MTFFANIYIFIWMFIICIMIFYSIRIIIKHVDEFSKTDIQSALLNELDKFGDNELFQKDPEMGKKLKKAKRSISRHVTITIFKASIFYLFLGWVITFEAIGEILFNKKEHHRFSFVFNSIFVFLIYWSNYILFNSYLRESDYMLLYGIFLSYMAVSISGYIIYQIKRMFE